MALNVTETSYERLRALFESNAKWASSASPNQDDSPDAPRDFNSLVNLLPGISDTGNLVTVLTAIFDQQAYVNTIDEINKPPSAYFRDFEYSSRETLDANEKSLERLQGEANLISRTARLATWQKSSSNISAKLAEMLEKYERH